MLTTTHRTTPLAAARCTAAGMPGGSVAGQRVAVTYTAAGVNRSKDAAGESAFEDSS